MDSRRLSEEQFERLIDAVTRQLRYHNRLCERMQQLRFPPQDPLAVYALRARHALYDLLNITRESKRAAERIRKA